MRNCKMVLKSSFWGVLVAALVLGILVPVAQAGVGVGYVIQPVDATWTKLAGTGFTEWTPNDYSGAGLLNGGETLVQTGDPIPAVWPVHTCGGNGTASDGRTIPAAANVNARGRNVTEIQIDYDLGGLHTVEGFALWNYAERHNGTWYNTRGIAQSNLEYSSDGGTTWLPLETMTFAETAQLTEFGPQIVLFSSGTVDATHIRFDNVTGISGTIFGIGEIRFIGDFYGAHTPTPTDGAVGVTVPVDNLLDLEWQKGIDGAGNPNADITKHYVRTTMEVVNGEPNFAAATATFEEVADGTDPQTTQLFVDYDQTIYWRVDESISDSAANNDANTVTGLVWQFSMQKSYPVINEQPKHTAAFPSEACDFTVAVTSVSTAHYQWYQSVDNANDTPDDDTPVGTDSDTYAIASAILADEGYYFCKVTNDTGEEGVVYSDTAYLTIKRQLLHWAFEQDFSDLSGEGNDGIPDTDPNWAPPTFEPNVPGGLGNNYAAKFDGVNQRITAPIDPNNGTLYAGYTLTMWVYTDNPNQGGSRSLFNNENGGTKDFQIDMDGKGNYRYYNGSSLVISEAGPQWSQIAVVCDGVNGTTMFYNLDARDVKANTAIDTLFGHFQLGCNRSETAFFEGMIDEVKVWNYPLTPEELAADYAAISGQGACLLPDGLGIADLNGDCRVNLGDFTEIALKWLECGLLPADPYCGN